MAPPPPAPPHDHERDESRPPRDRRASLGRLLGLARPEWRRLLAGTAFLAIGSLMTLLYPYGIRIVVDGALGQGRRDLIDKAAIAMVVIALLNGVAMALRFVLFTVAGERVVARLRRRLYQRIVAQEVAFFDERRTGELLNRLSSDTVMVQNAVSGNISMVLRNVAQTVGGIGFLLYTSPVLTALMLAVVPPIAVASVAYGRRIRKLSHQVQEAFARAGEIAEESISGIRTVRSFAAEGKEADRYGAAIERTFELARVRAWAGARFMAGASIAAFIAAAMVFWYGARLVSSGGMTVGGLTSFLVYTLVVAFSLGGLADVWADLMRSLGAAERVFDLIDREPEIPAHGGQVLANPSGSVAFEAVGFAYPSRPEAQVLDEVNLEMAPGEVVAVVGPSGAGKSTLSSLLTRFYDPGEGRILLDGVDLRALDPEWLRRRIGTVAQEPILFSTSIAENIRYGRPEASLAEVEAAARTGNAHDFIARFPRGYDTSVGERGVQLSGGQKQRVAIARAVLKDPLLLILDEATSALDAESEHLVKEAIERLMRGRTTLVIAHRLSTVAGADRVLVLDGGRIVQAGSHRALMAEEGLYRRLIERQFVAA